MQKGDTIAENKPQQGGKGATKGASSIIRIAGRDVDGSLNIERALTKVKGIGMNMAHAMALEIDSKLSISKATEIGSLSEKQMADLENLIKNPGNFGIPTYMLNRNKDAESGKTIHMVSNDLMFAVRQDINRDISNKTWRGHRHQYGQKVRGQHTRSTGRTGVTVGVTKKAVAAAQGAAKAPAQGAPVKSADAKK